MSTICFHALRWYFLEEPSVCIDIRSLVNGEMNRLICLSFTVQTDNSLRKPLADESNHPTVGHSGLNHVVSFLPFLCVSFMFYQSDTRQARLPRPPG